MRHLAGADLAVIIVTYGRAAPPCRRPVVLTAGGFLANGRIAEGCTPYGFFTDPSGNRAEDFAFRALEQRAG